MSSPASLEWGMVSLTHSYKQRALATSSDNDCVSSRAFCQTAGVCQSTIVSETKYSLKSSDSGYILSSIDVCICGANGLRVCCERSEDSSTRVLAPPTTAITEQSCLQALLQNSLRLFSLSQTPLTCSRF